MNADRLLARYDRVAETHDAVPRLRRFVLNLAVRGKLVGEAPDDESASELLKRIAAEKERLVRAGKIRKPRSLSNGESIDSAIRPSPVLEMVSTRYCWRNHWRGYSVGR